jgi:glycogen debranching enzyme
LVVLSGFEIVNRLERKDRHDLAGNRMTSYGTGLGGGSIYYWSGRWENNEDFLPKQMLSVFNGTDSCLEVLSGTSGDSMVQRYYHSWRPDRIESHYLTHDTVIIKERKTIHQDTFVDRLQFANQLQRDVSLVLRLKIPSKPKTSIEIHDGYVYMLSNDGRLAGIHRVIGFSKSSEFRQTQNALTIEVPITLHANVGKHLTSTVIYMMVSMADTKREALACYNSVKMNPEQSFKGIRHEWTEFFSHSVPKFSCDDKMVERMYYLAFAMVKTNTYDFRKGFLNRNYTCPSKFRLLPQWFWDTAFHAIYEKWLTDMPIPRQSLINILEGQDEDGHLPFIMDTEGSYLERVFSQKLMQPFILPIAIWDVYLKTGDEQFLKEALPYLVKFDRWIERERTKPDTELAFIVLSGESGWDNSKRFLFEKGSYVQSDVMTGIDRVYPVDVNTYVYIARHLIMQMAHVIGWDSLRDEYRKRRDTLAQSLARMYNSELGMYADIVSQSTPSSVKSPAGIIPILTGLADTEKLELIVNHLINPKEFWSRYPIPTLSMDDPDFNVSDEYQSYWNGRAWPPVNWMVIEGLFRNCYYALARELCLRTIDMVTCLGEPNFCENYHPDKPFCYDINQNIFSYGWGGLVNDLLIRRLLGIQPNASANSLYIYPMFPEDWNNAALSDLHVGSHVVDITYTKYEKKLRLLISHKGESALTVITESGTKVVLKDEIEFVVDELPNSAVHWLDM